MKSSKQFLLVVAMLAALSLGLTAAQPASAKSPWLPKSDAKKWSIRDGWKFVTFGDGDPSVKATCVRFSRSRVKCGVTVLDYWYWDIACVRPDIPYESVFTWNYFIDWRAKWTWRKRGLWTATGKRWNLQHYDEVIPCG